MTDLTLIRARLTAALDTDRDTVPSRAELDRLQLEALAAIIDSLQATEPITMAGPFELEEMESLMETVWKPEPSSSQTNKPATSKQVAESQARTRP